MEESLRKVIRPALFTFGMMFLIIGVAGVILPLLPGTPFLIISAYCFDRSSPRFHQWLVTRPILGELIRNWEENRVIRPKAKVMASVMIVLGIGSTLIFAKVHWSLKVMLLVIGISVMTFIARQKNSVNAQERSS